VCAGFVEYLKFMPKSWIKQFQHIVTMFLHGMIFITFAMMPFWIKHPAATAPFTSTYVLGFLLSILLVVMTVLWILSGFVGINRLFRHGVVLVWAIFMCLLALWVYFSQNWAFVELIRPEIAQNATLQWFLVAGFILILVSTSPSQKMVSLSIIVGVLINVLIGGIQVAVQSSINLAFLGEFVLDPAKSGVSVIQSGDVRWLRPYGLLPHPNILAGFIVIGIFALSNWLIDARRWVRVFANLTLLIFFWMLLLTFSRGAWLGLFVAGLVILPMIYRFYRFNRKILTSFLLLVCAGLCFVALYTPLLLARAGVGEESIELRSISDRIVYSQIAQAVIDDNMLLGIGAGNFPWYSSYYLHNFTDYDLQGDHVHNMYLELWTELGLIGLGLFVSMVFLGVSSGFRRLAIDTSPMMRIGWLGAVIAILVIGFVDHYPLTLIHMQAMWWGILALAIYPPKEPTNAEMVVDQLLVQQNNRHP